MGQLAQGIYGKVYEDQVSDPYLHFKQGGFGHGLCTYLGKIQVNRVITQVVEDRIK